MNKKIALVIGGTGGIGGGFIQVLSELDWKIFAPVRDLKKSEAVALQALPGVYVSECDVSDKEATAHYIQWLHVNEPCIDLVVLAAGTHQFDTDFPRPTIEEMVAAATDSLTKANLTTKKNVVSALCEAYGEALKKTVAVNISSHAAYKNFPGQVAYGTSMRFVSEYGKEIIPLFSQVITKETEVVDTAANRKNLTLEKIGVTVDFDSAPKPPEYAKTVLHETGLI